MLPSTSGLLLTVILILTKGEAMRRGRRAGGNLRPTKINGEYNKNCVEIDFSETCLDETSTTELEILESLATEYDCIDSSNIRIFNHGPDVSIAFICASSSPPGQLDIGFKDDDDADDRSLDGAFIECVTAIEADADSCIDEVIIEEVWETYCDPTIPTRSDLRCHSRSTDSWSLKYIDDVSGNNYVYYESEEDPLVDIYILDTGVRLTHNEFDGSVSNLGSSPTNRVGDHGTHVAGIAAGKNYGVASNNFKIYNWAVCESGCRVSDVVAGLQAVYDDQTSASGSSRRGVINMSFGSGGRVGTTLTDSRETLLKNLLELANVITVVSAGNKHDDACYYEYANSAYTISVGNYQSDLSRHPSSNYGDCVQIWGPGTSIRSSTAGSDSEYSRKTGTSMAAPHITGMVANMLANDKNFIPDSTSDLNTIISDLQSSAKDTVTDCQSTVCDAALQKCVSPLTSASDVSRSVTTTFDQLEHGDVVLIRGYYGGYLKATNTNKVEAKCEYSSDAQLWRVIADQGDGYIRFLNEEYTDKYLGVETSSNNLEIRRDRSSDINKWSLYANDDGPYENRRTIEPLWSMIKNKAEHTCINIQSTCSDNSVNVNGCVATRSLLRFEVLYNVATQSVQQLSGLDQTFSINKHVKSMEIVPMNKLVDDDLVVIHSFFGGILSAPSPGGLVTEQCYYHINKQVWKVNKISTGLYSFENYHFSGQYLSATNSSDNRLRIQSFSNGDSNSLARWYRHGHNTGPNAGDTVIDLNWSKLRNDNLNTCIVLDDGGNDCTNSGAIRIEGCTCCGYSLFRFQVLANL